MTTVQELIDALQKVENKDHRLSYVLAPVRHRESSLWEQTMVVPCGWVQGIETIEYHPDDREVELRIFK